MGVHLRRLRCSLSPPQYHSHQPKHDLNFGQHGLHKSHARRCLRYLPHPLAYAWEPWQNLIVSTQPINPLYIGPYAVGPHDSNTVAPSPGSVTTQAYYVSARLWTGKGSTSTSPTQPMSARRHKTASKPLLLPSPSTGWWTGNFCSYGHTAWSLLPVKAGRSFAIEVTALDESSSATSAKMMPVIGIWNATDSLATPPTIASTLAAFNTSSTAMTALRWLTPPQSQSPRIAIMDQARRRPSRLRLSGPRSLRRVRLSATVPSKGGSITITGMGFRLGNTVSINGTPAAVSSWTANTITAVAPALHNTRAVTADVTVCDLTTGSTTIMSGALSYQAPQPELTLVSAPTGTIFAQIPAAVPSP